MYISIDIVKIIVYSLFARFPCCVEEGMTLWSLALWVAESLRIPLRQWTWMKVKCRKLQQAKTETKGKQTWRHVKSDTNTADFSDFVHGISEGHCGGMAKAPTTRFGFSSDTWAHMIRMIPGSSTFAWFVLKRGGEFGNAFKHVVFAIAFSKKNFQGFAVPWICSI